MHLDFSHHVYLIEADKEVAFPDVLAAVEAAAGIPAAANPDVYCAEYDVFGIDESRELKAKQANKGFGGGKKFFIIAARSFTSEAQNALLKVFEEPTPDTHFVIVMSDASSLLPTLKSRILAVAGERSVGPIIGETARKFLKGDLALRMTIIKKMIEDKDKAGAQDFIEALVQVVYVEFQKKRTSELARVLEELERYRGYLADRSPSVKMILEHTALVVPQIDTLKNLASFEGREEWVEGKRV